MEDWIEFISSLKLELCNETREAEVVVGLFDDNVTILA